jgi:hypothetical protein
MVTSVGVSIDVHFCKGEIYSLGINSSADLCAGFYAQNDLEGNTIIKKSPCCDQFSAYFQSDIDSNSDDVAIQHSIGSEAIVSQFAVELPRFTQPIQLCHFYNPPEYPEDILTLFSVFRI